MKVILAFALFLAAVSAIPCSYTSTTDSTVQYYLGSIGFTSNNWVSANDVNGNLWSIRVCDDLVDSNPLCPVNSSICVTSSTNEDVSNRGTDSTAIVADSPSGVFGGLEVAYGADGVCPDDKSSSIKTIVEYVCSGDSVEVITIDSENCFTTITISSTYACPYHDEMTGDDEEGTVMIAPFMTFFGLVLMALVFVCMCCCCMIRKRRCQKKEIAMKQFSNVAFQPIPANQMNQQQPQMKQNPNFPAYNPYVQPQFLYYYPTQQQQQIQVPIQQSQQPQSPQVVELEQFDNDEKLAKQLQAQFDLEHQV